MHNMQKNKKADMAINYIFLIFIATIAVFVIVGLLTKWSFSTSKFMCKLTGECGQEDVTPDVQKINTTDCADFQYEIVKGAKLCYENGKLGRIKGTVCYAILGPNNCNINADKLKDYIGNEVNVTITYNGNSDKAIISYDYNTKFVKID